MGEGLLVFFFEKSISVYPIPAHSKQSIYTSEFSITYHYNNYGLRGKDIDCSSTYDIALIGDSFFTGFGVNLENTLLGFLDNKGHKVVNISENATNPPQYFEKLNILHQKGLKAKNYVVGLYLGNDFQNISKRGIEPLFHYQFTKKHLDYDVTSFFRLERLIYLVKAFYYKSINNQLFVHEFQRKKTFREDYYEWYTNSNRRAIEHLLPKKYQSIEEEAFFKLAQINENSTKKIIRILQAMKQTVPATSQFYVLLIADKHFAYQEYGEKYQQFVKGLIEELEQSNIVVWDSHPITSSDMFFKLDGHWNEKGHDKIGQFINNQIEMK